ncbi:MAG: hypothetical protein PHP50_11020 [Lachnospiraceae bacterium]|nr:hypothetical protein [Lachnospiraceae bacterium]
MFELKMYNGHKMTPENDAVIYNSIITGNGVVKGCVLSFLGANQVHITSGYMIIKGRLIAVTEETILVAMASSATVVPGRLYMHMDLSDTEAPVTCLSVAQSTLPDLVQDENCNYDDGIYEIELATYNAGMTAITDLTSTYVIVKGVDVLDTSEEIEANTEQGKVMGALAGKELFSSLEWKLIDTSPSSTSIAFDSTKYNEIFIKVLMPSFGGYACVTLPTIVIEDALKSYPIGCYQGTYGISKVLIMLSKTQAKVHEVIINGESKIATSTFDLYGR